MSVTPSALGILKPGDRAPTIDVPMVCSETSRTERFVLHDHKGQAIVLYFYPKDDTPGCTQEACDFRDVYSTFQASGIKLYGVSRDSVASHVSFIQKHRLPFPLLCDEKGDMCRDYGVWVEKNMYGKKYWGIERTTFLILPNGSIGHIWPKVKVPGHVAKVLSEAQSLLSKGV